MPKKSNVLVTGSTGQAASHLIPLLLRQGYTVHGIVRRSATPNTSNISPYLSQIRLFEGDITDGAFVNGVIGRTQYENVYHLAAQSHVRTSFDMPQYTLDTLVKGTLNILEAIRQYSPDTGMVHAASSEQFGSNVDKDGFQRETTCFAPNSPYACGKVCAFNLVKLYRDAYNLKASNCILFNYESEFRGLKFVSRKITNHVANMYLGKAPPKLYLGNLDAQRDWGYAGDYMSAFYLVGDQPTADDYVVATGETHTVKELLTEAFSFLHKDWQDYVEFDPELLRAKEVDYLRGDASKLRGLGWKPQITFKELIRKMILADIHNRVPSPEFFNYEKKKAEEA
jgi:GDPmannose 4,6-dehydratase